MQHEDAVRYKCSIDDASASYARLPLGIGVGPDDIPCELLRVGWRPVADLFNLVKQTILATYCFLLQCKGGKIADVYKGKGDLFVCDNSPLAVGPHFKVVH